MHTHASMTPYRPSGEYGVTVGLLALALQKHRRQCAVLQLSQIRSRPTTLAVPPLSDIDGSFLVKRFQGCQAAAVAGFLRASAPDNRASLTRLRRPDTSAPLAIAGVAVAPTAA